MSKVRHITHGPRDRGHKEWTRQQRRSIHATTRRSAVRWKQPRLTLTLLIEAFATDKWSKRQMKLMLTRAGRRKQDRILAMARIKGMAIEHRYLRGPPARSAENQGDAVSAVQKHEREAVRVITALCDGITADIHARRGHNAHKRMVVTFAGVTVQITISSSPGNPDNWLKQIKANTVRAFRARGITITT